MVLKPIQEIQKITLALDTSIYIIYSTLKSRLVNGTVPMHWLKKSHVLN